MGRPATAIAGGLFGVCWAGHAVAGTCPRQEAGRPARQTQGILWLALSDARGLAEGLALPEGRALSEGLGWSEGSGLPYGLALSEGEPLPLALRLGLRLTPARAEGRRRVQEHGRSDGRWSKERAAGNIYRWTPRRPLASTSSEARQQLAPDLNSIPSKSSQV